jgi:hypothetical protein
MVCWGSCQNHDEEETSKTHSVVLSWHLRGCPLHLPDHGSKDGPQLEVGKLLSNAPVTSSTKGQVWRTTSVRAQDHAEGRRHTG